MSRILSPFRPSSTTRGDLVRRAGVGPLAWAGMRLEGSIVPLWDDVAAAAGVSITPAMRLTALLDTVPRRCVIGRLAAAWVHAGGPTPARVVVLVPAGARHTDPHPRRVSAEADLPEPDVQRIGPGRVTTVQRTGLDVARWCAPDDARAALRLLVPIGFDAAVALRALSGVRGGRGVRTAHTLLTAL